MFEMYEDEFIDEDEDDGQPGANIYFNEDDD